MRGLKVANSSRQIQSCFVLEFANAHGSSEITTLAQDATETRLFTASADGTVKVLCFSLANLARFFLAIIH